MFDQWDMISFQTHPISKFYPQNSILTRVYKKQPGLVLQITCLVSEEVKLKKLNWIISSFHNLRHNFQLSIYVFSIIVLSGRHTTKIYRTDNHEKMIIFFVPNNAQMTVTKCSWNISPLITEHTHSEVPIPHGYPHHIADPNDTPLVITCMHIMIPHRVPAPHITTN